MLWLTSLTVACTEATSSYYYVWSSCPCFSPDGCSGRQYYTLHQGVDDDTATLNFATYTNWIQVHVQASENKSPPYNTGESQVELVMGPAGLGGGPGSCPSLSSSFISLGYDRPMGYGGHQVSV